MNKLEERLVAAAIGAVIGGAIFYYGVYPQLQELFRANQSPIHNTATNNYPSNSNQIYKISEEKTKRAIKYAEELNKQQSQKR